MSLAIWLHSLGFDVFYDTPDTLNRKDWLCWYAAHLITCENVIIICSLALANDFLNHSSMPPSSCTLYCIRLIRLLRHQLHNSHLRFFLVNVSPELTINKQQHISTIFADNKVYQLTDNTFPDTCHFAVLQTDYDQLVFDMCFHCCRPSFPTPDYSGGVNVTRAKAITTRASNDVFSTLTTSGHIEITGDNDKGMYY
jgi:hypothetical protein